MHPDAATAAETRRFGAFDHAATGDNKAKGKHASLHPLHDELRLREAACDGMPRSMCRRP